LDRPKPESSAGDFGSDYPRLYRYENHWAQIMKSKRPSLAREPFPERRKEVRYPVQAKAVIRKKSGQAVPATAVDLSSSGARLLIDPPGRLEVGEDVTIEVELSEDRDQPLFVWAAGKVVYIRGSASGIQLHGGHFHPLPFCWNEKSPA